MFYDLTYNFETDNAISFNRLGQSLTTIQLNFFATDGSYARFPRFRFAFARMRAECSCLTQVVLAVRSWHMLDPSTDPPTLPSTVYTLGICVMDAQISEVSVKHCFNTVLPLFVTCNPALKTIKFMKARNIRALRAHSISLWHGLRVMEKLGVAIKDWADRHIVPPSCQDIPHLKQQLDKPASLAPTLGPLLPTL
jgi:hypothetical protein